MKWARHGSYGQRTETELDSRSMDLSEPVVDVLVEKLERQFEQKRFALPGVTLPDISSIDIDYRAADAKVYKGADGKYYLHLVYATSLGSGGTSSAHPGENNYFMVNAASGAGTFNATLTSVPDFASSATIYVRVPSALTGSFSLSFEPKIDGKVWLSGLWSNGDGTWGVGYGTAPLPTMAPVYGEWLKLTVTSSGTTVTSSGGTATGPASASAGTGAYLSLWGDGGEVDLDALYSGTTLLWDGEVAGWEDLGDEPHTFDIEYYPEGEGVAGVDPKPPYKLYYAKYCLDTKSFVVKNKLVSSTYSVEPEARAAINAYSNGNLWAVWMLDDKSAIRSAMSTDGGSTWTNHRMIANGGVCSYYYDQGAIPSLRKSGSWKIASNSNAYGGSMLESATAGSSNYVEFKVTGSEIYLDTYTTKAKYKNTSTHYVGVIKIYIDGRLHRSFDCSRYSSGYHTRVHLNAYHLSEGQHTVKLVHHSGKYMFVDMVKVTKEADTSILLGDAFIRQRSGLSTDEALVAYTVNTSTPKKGRKTTYMLVDGSSDGTNWDTALVRRYVFKSKYDNSWGLQPMLTEDDRGLWMLTQVDQYSGGPAVVQHWLYQGQTSTTADYSASNWILLSSEPPNKNRAIRYTVGATPLSTMHGVVVSYRGAKRTTDKAPLPRMYLTPALDFEGTDFQAENQQGTLYCAYSYPPSFPSEVFGTLAVDSKGSLYAYQAGMKTTTVGLSNIADYVSDLQITHSDSEPASLNLTLLDDSDYTEEKRKAVRDFIDVFPKHYADKAPRLIRAEARFLQGDGTSYGYTLFTGVVAEAKTEYGSDTATLSTSAYDFTYWLQKYRSPYYLVYSNPTLDWGENASDYELYMADGEFAHQPLRASEKVELKDLNQKVYATVYRGWELKDSINSDAFSVDTGAGVIVQEDPGFVTSPKVGTGDYWASAQFTLQKGELGTRSQKVSAIGTASGGTAGIATEMSGPGTFRPGGTATARVRVSRFSKSAAGIKAYIKVCARDSAGALLDSAQTEITGPGDWDVTLFSLPVNTVQCNVYPVYFENLGAGEMGTATIRAVRLDTAQEAQDFDKPGNLAQNPFFNADSDGDGLADHYVFYTTNSSMSGSVVTVPALGDFMIAYQISGFASGTAPSGRAAVGSYVVFSPESGTVTLYTRSSGTGAATASAVKPFVPDYGVTYRVLAKLSGRNVNVTVTPLGSGSSVSLTAKHTLATFKGVKRVMIGRYSSGDPLSWDNVYIYNPVNQAVDLKTDQHTAESIVARAFQGILPLKLQSEDFGEYYTVLIDNPDKTAKEMLDNLALQNAKVFGFDYDGTFLWQKGDFEWHGRTLVDDDIVSLSRDSNLLEFDNWVEAVDDNTIPKVRLSVGDYESIKKYGIRFAQVSNSDINTKERARRAALGKMVEDAQDLETLELTLSAAYVDIKPRMLVKVESTRLPRVDADYGYSRIFAVSSVDVSLGSSSGITMTLGLSSKAKLFLDTMARVYNEGGVSDFYGQS